MLFTIVIINHNYGLFLTKAIDSALAQSYSSLEVVVVDDGSTDMSRDIIASYGNRIVPILKEAGGHVSAANFGYAAAKGEFIIFLDSDDILYKDCIQTVAANWRNGDVKLQYRLDTINCDGVDQHMIFPFFAIDLSPETIRHQSYQFGIYPWTVSSGNAFSSAYLDALFPIDEAEIYRSPDGYLSKMAPLFGDVRSIQDVLGAYRVHGANAWAQDKAGFRIEPIIRWLNFDRVLQTKFESLAQMRGISVVAGGNLSSTQQIEYRLLAFRFAADQSPYKNDKAISLVIAGSQATFRFPNISFPGCIMWSIWFFVLGIGPKFLVRWIYAAARMQTGRSRVSRLLVEIARGPAARSSYQFSRR